MLKEYGGFGIPDLRTLNLCLLGFWMKRYNQDEGKLWRQVIDYKYNTEKPNILACVDRESSVFWKGVMWDLKVAKMGYRWKVGNGKRIKFWEDVWVDSSSLAIQYWDLYCILNQQIATIAELWDGQNLKCTFRRCG